MGTAEQLFVNALIAGAGFALLAVSFSLIYNVSHFFHFAHGAVYTVAAYIAFTLISDFHFGVPVGILGAIIGSGVLGGLMEVCVYKQMRFRRATPVVLLLASLGLLIVVQNSVSMIYGNGIRLLPQARVEEGFLFLRARITPIQVATIAVSVAACIVVMLVVRFTSVGKAVRAVSNDPELARVVGVDSSRIILVAFLFGSSLAGVASVLAAYDTGLWPTMGFNALLMAVVAMVVGGIGSVSGSILGGFTIGFVQQISAWVLPSKWQDAIVFVVLIFFLLLRPHGVLGRRISRAEV